MVKLYEVWSRHFDDETGVYVWYQDQVFDSALDAFRCVHYLNEYLPLLCAFFRDIEVEDE